MSRRAVAAVLLGSAVLGSAAFAAETSHIAAWTRELVAPAPGQPDGYLPFQNKCAVCHGAGPAKPGTRALAAKYGSKLPALLEKRTDLTAELIKYTVRHGVSVMPPFRKTELTDAELDSIAAYLTRSPRKP